LGRRIGIEAHEHVTAVVRVAAAVILRADGAVLLAQRPQGKPYAGYWEFPGGKLEAGETPAHALARELYEELGITARNASAWLVQEFVYPHAHVELHFFRVFDFDGEPASHDAERGSSGVAGCSRRSARDHSARTTTSPFRRLSSRTGSASCFTSSE
jgi:8-oxo-dGTP diphosphatase